MKRTLMLVAVLVQMVTSAEEVKSTDSFMTALDARACGSVRPVASVDEMLPLAWSNDPDWSRGGLTSGSPASLVAMPVRAVTRPGGTTAYLPIGPSNVLVSVAGEGVVTNWVTTNASYRVTFRVGETVRDEAVFALTNVAPATLSVSNGVAPAVGRPLALVLSDDSGASSPPVVATWTRIAWNGTRDTGTVVAADAESYAPTADDCEHWLEATVGDPERPDYTYRLWFSKLPVAYVTTSSGENPVSKTVDLSGSFRLQGNGNWTDEKKLYDGELEKIHVRGNWTAGQPKKPYKIKLGEKADLLGMGKNKHWVLLANYADPGLLRNKTAYDLSGELGLTYMASEWVDVILNGKFAGNYQLCEHIRIDKTRIDICNWEDAAEEEAKKLLPKGAARDALVESMTADLDWLTSGTHAFTNPETGTVTNFTIDVSSYDLSGGYVYELDTYDDEPSRFFVTNGVISNALVKINAPETLATNAELLDEQKTLWTEFFASVQSENGFAKGKSWVERCDARSMAAYWLTQVFFTQCDGPRSRFAYRPQSEPIVFGPVWDFDNAVGGTAFSWSVMTNENGRITSVSPGSPTKGWTLGRRAWASDSSNFYPLWVDDPYFCLLLYELWRDHRAAIRDLVEQGGGLDADYEYLLESGRANDALWPVRTNGNAPFPFEGTNGNAQVMIRCLREQYEWIDGEMASLRKLVGSLNSGSSADHPYTDSPDALKMAFPGARPRPGSPEGETPDVIALPGRDVTGTVAVTNADTATVEVYVNGLAVSTNAVTDGAVAYSVPAQFLTAATGHRNLVALLSRDGQGTRRHTTYALVEKTDLESFPLVPEDLTVTVDASAFNPADPASSPVVTVTATNGVTLVEGRDYEVAFAYGAGGASTATVTGRGGYFRKDLADGQVNFMGTKAVAFAVDPVAARDGGTAALDTRPSVPQRTLASVDEVLPFAYRLDWFAGAEPAVTGISGIAVGPVGGGTETQLAVTNATAGLAEWVPSAATAYRAKLFGQTATGEIVALTVDIDLSGAPEPGVLVGDLPDDAGTNGSVRIAADWLDAYRIDYVRATNRTLDAGNGLPVWKSYILGLNPTGETVSLTADIAPGATGTFDVSCDPLPGTVRADLVNVWYRLLATGEPETDLMKYEPVDERREPGFTVTDEARRRFFRIRAVFYWNTK